MKKTNILWMAIIVLTLTLVATMIYYAGVQTQGFTTPPITTQLIPTSFSDEKVHTFGNEAELLQFLGGQSGNDNYYGRTLRTGAMMMESMDSVAVKSAPSPNAVASGSVDYSETNVQVQGIDEGDLIKTDGYYIYTITDDTLFIVKANPAESSEVISRTNFSSRPSGLLLVDDKLIVYGSLDWQITQRILPSAQMSFVAVYDVSDKENIKLENELQFEGYIQETREQNGEIIIVSNARVNTNDGYPTPILYDGAVVKEMPVDSIRYIGYYYDPTQYTTVRKIDVDSFKTEELTLLTDNAGVVYMSPENIYLTTTEYVNEWEITQNVLREVMEPYLEEADLDKIARIEAVDYDILSKNAKQQMIQQIYETKVYSLDEATQKRLEESLQTKVEAELNTYEYFTTTIIQRVSLDQLEVEATGEVAGRLNNQFSMDEYDTVLRVATTIDARWSQFSIDGEQSKSENHIYTLDAELDVLDSIKSLAVDESIYATRFVGERLYVVTFKQIDPFFVINLADPNDIEVLGELKIPGFSRYLHPYDENTIIGIGQDADEKTGRSQGLKISLFDVTDVTKPREIASYVTDEKYAQSQALYEHKAFLFDKAKELLVIPAYSPNYYWDETTKKQDTYNGAFVFNITKDEIVLRGLIDHDTGNGNYWQPQVERSLYIENYLFTKSPYLIRVNDLADLESVANVTLTPIGNNYGGDIILY